MTGTANQSKPLSGKVALVTGSRGIGKGIAIALAQNGANVAVTYSSPKSKASGDELVAALEKLGVKAVAYEYDVKAFAKAPQLIESIVKAFGGLDILVNNAGVAGHSAIADTTSDEFDEIFNTNVKGLYLLTAAASKVLKDNGRIINITSVVARSGFPNSGVYSGSKAAVESFTRVWATELAPRHITANSVAPGVTESEMFRKVDATVGGAYSEYAKTIPGGRVAQPDDIADVVAFLASDKARWITGSTVNANGGAYLS